MLGKSGSHGRGLWCILLAAGGSRRLGRPKQLIRRRGRPLLLHAAAAASRLLNSRVVAVLGADGLRLRGVLRRGGLGIRIVENRHWRSGMAGSLRLGLARLPRNATAALIVLVDQPGVGTAALSRLIERWRSHPRRAAAALYPGPDGKPLAGAPAILPRAFWPLARGLHGDTGARSILRRLPRLTEVAMPEAAFDIDTTDDLRRLEGGDFKSRRGRG